MDLDSLQVQELADELVEAYASLARDEGLASLVNFYKCHRACIRAKVAALKALESEVPAAEREQAAAQSRALFALAMTYANQGRPCLIAVCGLAGSGKSTIAEMLRRLTGFEVYNSDRVRKQLAGIAEVEHPKNEYAAGIYSPGFDHLTYEMSIEQARDSMRMGCGAIVDATFKQREYRKAALELGRGLQVPVLFVECRASDEETLRRLLRRASEGTGVSDAGVEVYEHQKRDFAPLTEVPERSHLVLDTTLNRRRTLEILRDALARTFEGGDTHHDLTWAA
jgi:predicted kinase